jgi:hypothetical protein
MVREFGFNFGDEVAEKNTGLTGVVMAMTAYATGCVHVGILPKKLTKDGGMREWVWLDETYLILKKAAKLHGRLLG